MEVEIGTQCVQDQLGKQFGSLMEEKRCINLLATWYLIMFYVYFNAAVNLLYLLLIWNFIFAFSVIR